MVDRVLGATGTVGKDYRIGLMLGLVLALVALVWVATRPGLSPQAQRGAPQTARGGPQRPGFSVLDDAEGVQNKNPLAAMGDPPPNTGPAAAAPPPVEEAPQQPRRTAEAATGPKAITDRAGLPDLTIYEKAEKIKTTRFHIVRQGETLSAIARQYYGSPEAWRKIVAANSKTIKDVNKVAPGTKLIIPE